MNDHQGTECVPGWSARLRAWCGVVRNCRRSCATGVLVAFIFASRMAAAQEDRPTDAASVSSRYVEQYVERLRAEARGGLLARQNERLQSGGLAEANAGLPGKLVAASPEVRPALVSALAGSVQPVEQDLGRAVEQLDQRIGEIAAAWRSLRFAVCESQSLLSRMREVQNTGAMSLLSLEDRWFWASILLALGGLASVWLHTHRHDLRRRWRGRRGRIAARGLPVGVFVVLACAVAVLGMADRLADQRQSSAAERFDAPREKMAEDCARLKVEIQRLAETIQAATKTRSSLEQTSGQRLAATAADLSKAAADFRSRVLDLAERVAVLEGLAGPIQADWSALAQIQEELTAASDTAVRHRQWQAAVRGGIGLATLGVVLGGGWRLGRRTRRRQAAVANTCPLCLGEVRSPAASRNGHTAGGQKIVRCTNVLDSTKNIRCDYAIRDAYRAMPKLCFPTLGVPRAGKTHWLAMVYWQLNRGNYPQSVRFERVRPIDSISGEDFDRIVEQILISRLGTTGTQGARIPHPLVFNFSDRDRWGRSSLLVNLFDYSGEVTAALGADDYRRRRAMEADGYLFFLDPTLPAEPQAKALAEFREDLRLIKGLSSAGSLRLPLAFCVSKIDLLARQPYALPDGGDAVARFYEELAAIDPSGESMRLDVLEERSRAMARLRDTIWPGWQIERTVEDVFGGRSLFFPLTPVGLDGRGETDLSLRTIAPFGLLEPLAWLLEMNGYPVLE